MGRNRQEFPLAEVPPMGWMSWNMFDENIHEDLIKETADAMVASGMRDVGYQYICIDDGWSLKSGRNSNGNLVPDPDKFPSGMKALADYVHSLGLKLGIYSDACEFTCAGWPGSYGYEERDAELFASWGIDFLKYDFLFDVPQGETAESLYTRMGNAVMKVDRSIFFAVCEWGFNKPHLWARRAGGHMWRTTWDTRDMWEATIYDVSHNGILNILDLQVGLEEYAGPGGWNDPDMLLVGLYGRGTVTSKHNKNGCTDVEYRSQMSLWCLLSAPLLASCDLRDMNQPTLETLTNREVIQVNQDRLGVQASRVYSRGGLEVWKKPLQGGDVAIGLLNRRSEPAEIEISWEELGISGGHRVRDLWKHADLGVYQNNLSSHVESHATEVYRLSPINR